MCGSSHALSSMGKTSGGWEPKCMSEFRIRAVLEDGPRTGEALVVDAGPDGGPPRQVVVADPLGMGARREESFDTGASLHAATTYHLHEQAQEPDTYRYRTGEPDQ
jgi:hypothetical protein